MRGLPDEKNWLAEVAEEVAERGRQLRAEAGQRRKSPGKRILREEVAERRLVKEWLTKEAVHSSIHSLLPSF